MLLRLFNSLSLYTADEWMWRQIRKVTDRVFDAIKNESGRANLKFEDLYIAVLIVYKWDVCFITVFQHFSLVDKIFFWFKLWVHLNNSSKSGCFYVLVISISIFLVHMLILPQKAKSKKSRRYFIVSQWEQTMCSAYLYENFTPCKWIYALVLSIITV